MTQERQGSERPSPGFFSKNKGILLTVVGVGTAVGLSFGGIAIKNAAFGPHERPGITAKATPTPSAAMGTPTSSETSPTPKPTATATATVRPTSTPDALATAQAAERNVPTVTSAQAEKVRAAQATATADVKAAEEERARAAQNLKSTAIANATATAIHSPQGQIDFADRLLGTSVPSAVPTPTRAPTPTARPTATPIPTWTPTPKPTEAPRPTSTPKPTETPAPTATARPEPTKTPTVVPTPTARPTATPKPTEAPRPTPDTRLPERAPAMIDNTVIALSNRDEGQKVHPLYYNETGIATSRAYRFDLPKGWTVITASVTAVIRSDGKQPQSFPGTPLIIVEGPFHGDTVLNEGAVRVIPSEWTESMVTQVLPIQRKQTGNPNLEPIRYAEPKTEPDISIDISIG